ncbi:envelope stress response membrane protein PspC [Vibrio parahaemolyticus]|uniref:Envelope stress response membrane protein PspC n=1 Tax=Vibrio parahaemolyticus TaxID=670 RepID=A0AAW8Q436_VIBPH|nr:MULTISPECIES: envelope stress response membrane protein PspC [Vibrio]MBE3698676.1 envelope stress response membrane protein PspC [Vibrio parahaemolyticus]MBE3778604.1 envelope stress response membrane protein PspC [Vibrio parahaemolyticus]MCZ5867584.1 envelope stress response membrane protein PspC [Vibrio parahaemolyticus]MCZ5898175.1 envelope stress response membrane protein PspC [Vibrio parahaemolyticus]MCZ6021619.1 envelope stress response membrane protein PspC [Vibrio parahaemolyticus]
MNNRELYRDPVNGKISGVCAGFANYFGAEVWLIRIVVISAALLGGTFLVVLAYIAMAFMLEKQPVRYSENIRELQEHTLKSKPWQKGQSPDQLLSVLERDFDRLDGKIRNMEAYVTSDTFRVNREFSKL